MRQNYESPQEYKKGSNYYGTCVQISGRTQESGSTSSQYQCCECRPKEFSVKRTSNILPHKWFPTILRELHVLAFTDLERDAAVLVEAPEPECVCQVRRLQHHRHNRLLSRIGPRDEALRRRIRPEPCALLRDNGLIIAEHDQDKIFQLLQVVCIRCVDRLRHLVVDVCEEAVRLPVRLKIIRVTVVLRLYDIRLCVM